MRRGPSNWSPSVLLTALLASAPAAVTAQVLTMEAVTTEAREGQEIELRLLLDQPAEFAFMAEVQLAGTGATGGTDFAPTVIPVTFQENDVVKGAVVNLIDDPEDEIYREIFVASVGDLMPLDPETVPSVINGAGSIPLTVIDDDNAFSVSAQPGPEGGVVVLTMRQQYDSEIEEVVVADPGAGSATPGLDFEPWQKVARFPPGQTEASMTIGLKRDAEVENTETFPIEMAYMGSGTATFDRGQGTGTITDETEREIPVRTEMTPGTVQMEFSGRTFTESFQHEPFKETLIRHLGGTRMTSSRPDGKDLELHRYRAEETDFGSLRDLCEVTWGGLFGLAPDVAVAT